MCTNDATIKKITFTLMTLLKSVCQCLLACTPVSKYVSPHTRIKVRTSERLSYGIDILLSPIDVYCWWLTDLCTYLVELLIISNQTIFLLMRYLIYCEVPLQNSLSLQWTNISLFIRKYFNHVCLVSDKRISGLNGGIENEHLRVLVYGCILG